MKSASYLIVLSIAVMCFACPVMAEPEMSSGQSVYVPVYSHIYGTPQSIPINLTALLSVRNTDPHKAVTIASVDYFDSQGKLINKALKKPFDLGPLATWEHIVPEMNTEGGSGANFIVRWNAAQDVNIPMIECVMITTRSGLGISFITRGKAIRE
ncbi:DUF3124 domain-containing protein [Desulfomonile tiedjei]|uniref:DUF3124 domain-containing protein n=1 Tax=Desulfomonile tiedjei (strain ATCC 49306 / DSM 6799 / DCB-1) TaxID=706587 RepID=I4CDJ8_DESTA|nr:DUF3124 domain-containing protein [Desulfomonile tiedjei]AFM27639.1 Protein of unknown function (DUF3124) [Desulfomonile tiedjei DSM 6799]